jgi:hypothetical protein
MAEARPNFALARCLEQAAAQQPEYVMAEPSAPAEASLARHGTLPALARRGTTDFTPSAILEAWAVPYGLADLLEQEAQQIARRVFLLDNSGSTSMADGKVLQDIGRGMLQEMPCTRWEEVVDMAQTHARWNMVLGVPCEFHVLNPIGDPNQEGTGFVVTSADRGPAEPQLAMLTDFLKRNGPKGVTPLANRLGDIRQRIERERMELLQQGQRVVLIIATDGMPTSAYAGQSTARDREDLVQALRRLSALDVHLVLRLCTDDDAVVDFYGDVDKEIELSLEVLDDLSAEATELKNQGNKFLTYSPLLHRIRESGTFFKVLDIVDERQLTNGEIYLLAQLLLRRSPNDPLLPRDPREFCDEVERRMREDPTWVYFEPRHATLAPPLNIEHLRYAMGVSGVKAVLKNIGSSIGGLFGFGRR